MSNVVDNRVWFKYTWEIEKFYLTPAILRSSRSKVIILDNTEWFLEFHPISFGNLYVARCFFRRFGATGPGTITIEVEIGCTLGDKTLALFKDPRRTFDGTKETDIRFSLMIHLADHPKQLRPETLVIIYRIAKSVPPAVWTNEEQVNIFKTDISSLYGKDNVKEDKLTIKAKCGENLVVEKAVVAASIPCLIDNLLPGYTEINFAYDKNVFLDILNCAHTGSVYSSVMYNMMQSKGISEAVKKYNIYYLKRAISTSPTQSCYRSLLRSYASTQMLCVDVGNDSEQIIKFENSISSQLFVTCRKVTEKLDGYQWLSFDFKLTSGFPVGVLCKIYIIDKNGCECFLKQFFNVFEFLNTSYFTGGVIKIAQLRESMWAKAVKDKQVVRIMLDVQISNGEYEMHRHGVICGDVYPENSDLLVRHYRELLESGRGCDCVVFAGSCTGLKYNVANFLAHRAILKARCPELHAHNPHPSRPYEVSCENESLWPFLLYVYTGGLPQITTSIKCNLQWVANHYSLQKLTDLLPSVEVYDPPGVAVPMETV